MEQWFEIQQLSKVVRIGVDLFYDCDLANLLSPKELVRLNARQPWWPSYSPWQYIHNNTLKARTSFHLKTRWLLIFVHLSTKFRFCTISLCVAVLQHVALTCYLCFTDASTLTTVIMIDIYTDSYQQKKRLFYFYYFVKKKCGSFIRCLGIILIPVYNESVFYKTLVIYASNEPVLSLVFNNGFK